MKQLNGNDPSIRGWKACFTTFKFSTSNGPDVRVVLVPTNRLKNNEDVKNHQYIELGKLKGNKGDQNYEIPEGIDVSTYGSVSIWCKRFNENFGAAYFEK